jgi:hypothetical protein
MLDRAPPSSSGKLFFFDQAESSLVDEVMEALLDRKEQHEALQGSLARLTKLAELIRDSPSMATGWHARGRPTFSGETLIDLLCRVPDYDLDLNIPTKALIGQTYLIAKINFLKALGYALESLASSTGDVHASAADASDLWERVHQELGQSIYSKLAEELFVSIVTDPDSADKVKTAAARYLFRIWEERLLIEVDDFAPALEAIWRARTKVLPVLGTMLGTREVFDLFNKAGDSRFLDYFGEDGVTSEQVLAFEEFLFGMSYEQIAKLREHLANTSAGCVSVEQARDLLGQSGSWGPPPNNPQAFYTSYKKRRVKAHYRALTGTAGPKKTAEEYVMTALLQRGTEF